MSWHRIVRERVTEENIRKMDVHEIVAEVLASEDRIDALQGEVDTLQARVRELEADPRMALTRDDLAVAQRTSEREAAAYAPGSITGQAWRRRAERLARAMTVAALAAVDAEGKQP